MAAFFLRLALFFAILEFLAPEVCGPHSRLLPVLSTFEPLAYISNVSIISEDCHFASSGFYDTNPSNVAIFAQCRKPKEANKRSGQLKVLEVSTGTITPYLPSVPFSHKIVPLRDGGRVEFTFKEGRGGRVTYIFRRLDKDGVKTNEFDFLGGADMNNMFYDEDTENICFIAKLNMCFFNRSVEVLCGDNLKDVEEKVQKRSAWFKEYSVHSRQSAKLIRRKEWDLEKYVPLWKGFDKTVTIGTTFGLPYYTNSSQFKKGGDSTQISGRVTDVYTLSIFKKRDETYYGLVYLHEGLEGYPKLMRPYLYCANSTHFSISRNLISNANYFKYMMIICADGAIEQKIYCTGVNPANNPTRENRVVKEHDKVLLTVHIPTLQNFENACFSQKLKGTVYTE